jgi:dihydroorotate dehydrogenase electron transfer subunit
MKASQRNTICVEDAEVIHHIAYPENQFVLRLRAPGCAATARPGSFVHLQCNQTIPMRRPLSIMRANADESWIELLYKTMGAGLTALSQREPGDKLSIIGPIGNGFSPDPDRPKAVMIGGGVGIPPLICLAEALRRDTGDQAEQAVAFFGSELPFPFELTESKIPLPGSPASASNSLEVIENLGITCRLATTAGFPGCFDGYVTDLARAWLNTLSDSALREITIFACGPGPMLRAAAGLAKEFDLPSQLCLEEFMACAVGGCAGCAVQVETSTGTAMKRVCVDGPVFNGNEIFPVADS